MTPALVLTGLDRLAEGREELPVRGRAALLTNQSGLTRSFTNAAEILAGLPGIELVLLLSPEHGLYGEAQDQVLTDDRTDPLTGLPVVNLYGNRRKPEPRDLDGIDLVVVDIQDVGSRYYTFAYTMALVMEAAGDAGIPVVVLDRPNPVGGLNLEGNVVREGYFTFVGLYPLAVRHGMTIAELATFFVRHCGIKAELHTILMEGWERGMYWEETGLPWIPPSPNMPAVSTALVYPGTCLIEATNLSEGRGTTRPFEVVGAPYLKPNVLKKRLEALDLSGVTFRPIFFEPTFSKWAGERCGGLWLHVTDRQRFKPFLTGVAIIREVLALCGDSFKWLEPPYEYEYTIRPIDMLAGNSSLRKAVEAGWDLPAIERSWEVELTGFRVLRESCLLY